MSKRNWIDVDLDGLEQTLTRRAGAAWLLHELLSNVYDTNATTCAVTIEPVPGAAQVSLRVVDDDPDGFRDLAHAWTLFASSERKGDPDKRGRWNAGCKLVLARCVSAVVRSTTGSVIFDEKGRRENARNCTGRGSEFIARVRMTREELEAALREVWLIIPPIETTINGKYLQARKPVERFDVALPTEIADADGYLRRTTRTTFVNVYHREAGCPGRIYELGIPVVETDDPWIVDVGQKVPLNFDRDNVTPAYLRELRVAVVNRMHEQLRAEDVATPAVQAALADKRIDPAAVETILTAQYGEKRAVFDPSDTEANHRLVADGYTIIPGGAFSKDAWANIRTHGAARPSGQIRPTPRPYSPDGTKLAEFVPEEEWTKGMRNVADYCVEVGWRLLHKAVRVRFEKKRMTADWAANYGAQILTFNYDRIGHAYFERGISEGFNDLLIHELAHEFSENHLATGYHDACTRLGAKLVELALREPELFKKHGWRAT